MTFRVTITPQAREDIDRNSDWWASSHSVDQALRWSDTIFDQIETLAELPESHALAIENEDFPFEIRNKLVGLGRPRRYRAIFTIRENRVLVLAVRAAEEDRLAPDDVDLSDE